MPRQHTQRQEETQQLSELERNTVPPVLTKKQRQAQEKKFQEEGYVVTDVGLNVGYMPAISISTYGPHPPIFFFLRMFTSAMFSGWKRAMNEHLHDQGIPPVSKWLLRKYLGMIIYFCIHPLDLLNNHWKAEHRHHSFLARALFERIHRNRQFSIRDFFTLMNRAFRKFIRLGTEITIDECQAAFAGASPVLAFNGNKPHKWGHLFYLAGTRINKRPYIYAVTARYPGWKGGKPSTLDIVKCLDACIPEGPRHITTDCFYNTIGVRDYFLKQKRYFTMAARADWLPHVWKTLQLGLANDTWKMAEHTPTKVFYVSYSSEKIVNTVSNAFVPIPDTRGNTERAPSPFLAYRANFNVIDLFDRLYYQQPFPHRHANWRDHFFYVMLKICIVNAWVLYNAAKGGEEDSLHDFMESIANAFLGEP